MTHEERVAEYEREKAEAPFQKNGSVSVGTQVLHEGNAVSGEIVNGVATERSWEDRTDPGGWSARQEGVPERAERPRPASKETLVVRPRRKR